MANGDTKTEAMLNVLGNGGSGDEFRGCCNTKTQSYILDAIDRINAIQPGGSSDFNDLDNRPQLNGVAMTGNTNITDFVGTDGTNAGAQGLVPAPATTDADKFLKSDGTWATAGGGGPTVVQTPGGSTTDVMSQDATTKMIYAAPNTANARNIAIPSYGGNTNVWDYANSNVSLGAMYVRASESVCIGTSSNVQGYGGGMVAVGSYANCDYTGGVALGYMSGSNITDNGMVDVSSVNTSYGYDNTNYRLITGVHDAQNAHDAVTLGQLNALITELQALGLNVSLQGAANNANQNSGSSEDPGTSAEPDPGATEPTITCPNCQQQTSEMSPICEHCGYDLSGGGGESPDDPAEPAPEDAEAPAEG